MLQSITWYQFFYTIGGAAGLYYVSAFVYFYQEEIKALFKGELEFSRIFISRNETLRINRSSQEDIQPNIVSETTSDENDEALVGKVSDLVEEIKSITIRNESLSKEKAKTIFKELLKRYSSLIGTHYQETISLFIADTISDKGGYPLDRKEVQSWWPAASEVKKIVTHFQEKGKALAIAMLVYLLLPIFEASAQDGNAGINEATMRVRSFFATGVNLTYAIGAIIGLIGAVKVYQKWNSGDQDTGKVAASWFGSCVFLVITATVLRSFFGV